MSYAEIPDVKARAGRLAFGWDGSSVPGEAEIERFLDDTAAEMDASLAAAGYTNITDPIATNALRGMNADGALVLALDASFPGGTAPAEVATLRNAAEKRYQAKLAAISGSGPALPALAYLEAGTSAPSATAFWLDEPAYGEGFTPSDDNYRLMPTFARGDLF